jgi:TPR repeat protein
MGSALSTSGSSDSPATITTVQNPTNTQNNTKQPKNTNDDDDDDDGTSYFKTNTKALETPILMTDDDDDFTTNNNSTSFPTPTGQEYDLIDKIASELPSIIDEESNQQVQDYIEACNNGKGPMVACFSTAEYLSLFLRKHYEASLLYENTCFRKSNDNSSNGVYIPKDKSKAYPPSCFNLAQMRMTGKGNTKFDRYEGYKLFERGCIAGHGGSCHMQAKMLASYPKSLGPKIPYNPKKSANLLNHVCKEHGDSLSCFTLATMLLRGDHVNNEADNVSPDEARGLSQIKQRKNENDRTKSKDDVRVALERDPIRAKELLELGCVERGHAPSCYNLAVMHTMGDDGVEVDEKKAEMYQKKTEELVDKFGGFGFGGSMG